MRTYSLSHLGDGELLRNCEAVVARNCGDTAELLAHIAEIDERKLFLPEGFPSMHEYCVQHLHLSEDAAYKRIQAARTARQFPAFFEAVAAGRVHLAAVVLLAPHLTAGNAGELLAVAAHRSKAEIRQLLAERYPRSEMLSLVQALPGSHAVTDEPPFQEPAGRLSETANVRTRSKSLAPGQVGVDGARAKVTPLAPQRFALQFTVGQSAYEKMCYAQALLGHQLPAGEIPEVFERGMDALIAQLEKRKFSATSRPRPGRLHSSTNPRHIPAEVKRAVWERDGGRCAFESEGGQRCPARTRLEFDHIEPVARGGEATVAHLRLACRGHNAYAAECTFGAGFMSDKRAAARNAVETRRQETAVQAAEVAEARRQETAAQAAEVARRRAEETRARAAAEEIVTPLRLLGCRAEEARRIAATCATIPDASLEERLRFALRQLASPHRRVGAAW